jgi:hypothetical protein
MPWSLLKLTVRGAMNNHEADGPEAPTPAAATKACRICGEDIKLSAIKCTHCDSYQDWRSSLTFSSTILSLLVALIAVLTAALPVVTREFSTKHSRILFSYLWASSEYVSVLSSNSGNSHGAVHSAWLLVDEQPRIALAIVGLAFDGVELIPENKNVLINFYPITPPADFKLSSKLDACYLQIIYRNFSEDSRTLRLNVPNCAELAEFLSRALQKP